MTDEPTTKTDSIRPADVCTPSGGSPSIATPSTSPAPRSSFADPVRREFGDNPDDAGEGHKGPRVDATTVPSDTRSQGDRSNLPGPSSQLIRKAQPSTVQGNVAADGGTSGNRAGEKTDRSQSDTRSV